MNPKNFKVISFYSDLPNTSYYTDCYNIFKNRCQINNLDPYIENLKSTNSYRLNCLRKPKFILDVLLKLKMPVFWVDIDSLICSNLNEINDLKFDYDLAFSYSYINVTPKIAHLNKLIPKASPIYFNYSENSINFLIKWVHECEKNEKQNGILFDHEILVENFISTMFEMCRIYTLNYTYCLPLNEKTIINDYSNIVMGISKHEYKKEDLRKMGLCENRIKQETGG